MSWLDIHKKRMANEGSTIKENYEKQIENFIDVAFADSPTYLKVLIEDTDYDARLVTEKKYTVASGYEAKKLIFRPHIKVTVGKIAKFQNKNWLIVFFEDRELEPKAHIRFCNNVLKLKNGAELPCVIEGKANDSQKIKEETYIDLSSDTLKVTIGYNEDSKKIQENDRFIINETAWETQGVGKYATVYNEEGIVELTLKKVAMKDEEKPEIAEEIIPRDYFVKIVGDSKVKINSTNKFGIEFYIGSVLTTGQQESIAWSASEGSISADGLFKSTNKKNIVLIEVEYQYVDENYNTKTILASKEIEVFDPNEWSWG